MYPNIVNNLVDFDYDNQYGIEFIFSSIINHFIDNYLLHNNIIYRIYSDKFIINFNICLNNNVFNINYNTKFIYNDDYGIKSFKHTKKFQYYMGGFSSLFNENIYSKYNNKSIIFIYNCFSEFRDKFYDFVEYCNSIPITKKDIKLEILNDSIINYINKSCPINYELEFRKLWIVGLITNNSNFNIILTHYRYIFNDIFNYIKIDNDETKYMDYINKTGELWKIMRRYNYNIHNLDKLKMYI